MFEDTQLFSNVATYYSLYFHSRTRITVRLSYYFSMTRYPPLRSFGYPIDILADVRQNTSIKYACCAPQWYTKIYSLRSLYYTPLKVKKEKTNNCFNLKRYLNLFYNRNIYGKLYGNIVQNYIIDYKSQKNLKHTHTFIYIFLEYTYINIILNDISQSIFVLIYMTDTIEWFLLKCGNIFFWKIATKCQEVTNDKKSKSYEGASTLCRIIVLLILDIYIHETQS